MPVIVCDDTEAAADRLRPLFASFIGPGNSFHAQAFTRMGHEGIVASGATLWRDGKQKEAAAQIPTWLVEQLALIGPPGKIREELPAWRDSLLTTLLVHLPPHPPALRQVAELLLG